MMDAVEQELRATLADAAGRVQVPRCDANMLAAAGRREAHHSRVRRAWLTAASVAATLVVAGAGALTLRWAVDGSPSPQPSDHTAVDTPTTAPSAPLTLATLPRGQPPAVPYWALGELHVGPRVVSVESDYLLGSQGVTLVVTRGARGNVAEVVGRRLVTVAQGASLVSISPSGEYAAWEVDTGSRITLVLWSVPDRAEVARYVTSMQHASCCGGGDAANPLAVDDRGRVYFGNEAVMHLWDGRGGTYVLVKGAPAHAGFGGARLDGAAYHVDQAPGDDASTYGAVDPNGSFNALGRYPGSPGAWSPDASRVAYIATDGGAYVSNLTSGRTVPLDVPSDVSVTSEVPAWEDGTNVLVTGFRNTGARYAADAMAAVLRCSSADGSCEVAMLVPHGGHLLLPKPSWWS